MVTTTAAKQNKKFISLSNSGVVSHCNLAVVVGLHPLLQLKGVTAIMKKSNILQKGQNFGRLAVVGLDHIKEEKDKKGHMRKREYYKCICECGKETVVKKQSLTSGETKSCGCLNRELASKRMKKQNFKHGLSNTKIFKIWANMKDRCYNSKCQDFVNYGARDIQICSLWLNSFIDFYTWAINNGYKEGLTIERIDVNGNYEPKNCKWIENALQSKNKTNSHYLTYNGKTQIIEDWAKEMNFKHGATISSRLKLGWTIEEALTTPVGQKHKQSRV